MRAFDPARRPFASFDATTISYLDVGAGEAVVLLHGIGVDALLQWGPFEHAEPTFARISDGFREIFGAAPPPPDPPATGRGGLIHALSAAGFRVIAPDMRGFGASGTPHEDPAYADSAMARDVLAMADHLSLNRFHVVGFSMGRVTAARLLALAPSRVDAAVLAGVGDYILEGEFMQLPENFPLPPDLPRPLTITAHANRLATVLEAGRIVAGDLMSLSLIAVRATGGDAKAHAAAVRGSVAPPVPIEPLRHTTARVLVLNGAADVANRQFRRLLDVIPGAVEGQCEGDHQTTPWEPTFHNAVIAFLRTASTDGGAV